MTMSSLDATGRPTTPICASSLRLPGTNQVNADGKLFHQRTLELTRAADALDFTANPKRRRVERIVSTQQLESK